MITLFASKVALVTKSIITNYNEHKEDLLQTGTSAQTTDSKATYNLGLYIGTKQRSIAKSYMKLKHTLI